MNAILSIKPEYVSKIKKGNKKFEFRKSRYRECEKIFVYETVPTKMITLILEFDKPIVDTPLRIWEDCNKHAGISKKDFFDYYEGRDIAYAYPITKVEEVNIDPYTVRDGFKAPQSIIYIK